jgi:hypothetical protein
MKRRSVRQRAQHKASQPCLAPHDHVAWIIVVAAGGNLDLLARLWLK